MLLTRANMTIMGATEEKVYLKQAKIMVQYINKYQQVFSTSLGFKPSPFHSLSSVSLTETPFLFISVCIDESRSASLCPL